MNNTILSFLITSLAGFTTLIGIIPCFIKDKYKNYVISSSLAFSSGVMLSMSLLSLIPETIILLNKILTGYIVFFITLFFIILGIIISHYTSETVDELISNNKLYKLGIISIIVLVLHNIPEGITTFISSTINTSLGLKLAIAISLHNIPEGIAIAVPIYYSTKNILKALSYTIIAGFSELLGAILAYLFISKYVTTLSLAIILALTAGIMIYISIYELLPNSLEYKNNKGTIVSFIIGFILMVICEFIL